ncbi:hypothetical protein Ahy_B10g102392 isoform B [Arachis hypogaea]|uniref:Uncharacterized protein n=1 Tax=Arachis hypogaea TaxID=3818 RepID=A0A444X1W4_ARAHY|nr:hypothetical protein Ahy_B10g102392 isoform B [Arachis hypogaea]
MGYDMMSDGEDSERTRSGLCGNNASELDEGAIREKITRTNDKKDEDWARYTSYYNMGLILQLGQQSSSGPNQGSVGNGGKVRKSGPHQTEPGWWMQGFWGEKVPDPCAAASKKPHGDERAALHGSPQTWRNGEGRVANGEASAWRLQLGVCLQRSNATVDPAEDDAVVVDGGAGASMPGSHEAGTNMAVWDKLNARKVVVEKLGGMVTRCSRDDGEDADMLRGVGNASEEGDDTGKTSTEGENDAGSENGNTTSSKHGVDHESIGLKHRGDMIGRKDSEKGEKEKEKGNEGVIERATTMVTEAAVVPHIVPELLSSTYCSSLTPSLPSNHRQLPSPSQLPTSNSHRRKLPTLNSHRLHPHFPSIAQQTSQTSFPPSRRHRSNVKATIAQPLSRHASSVPPRSCPFNSCPFSGVSSVPWRSPSLEDYSLEFFSSHVCLEGIKG